LKNTDIVLAVRKVSNPARLPEEIRGEKMGKEQEKNLSKRKEEIRPISRKPWWRRREAKQAVRAGGGKMRLSLFQGVP